MCINQARKSYVSSKTRDSETQKAEVEKREKLYGKLNEFFDVPEIQKDYMSTKLDQLSIAELEQLEKQCENKFDTLKTKEMIKHGLVLLQTGYDSMLPNGIPLGKSRHLVIGKGVIDTISSSLFDVRTVQGLATRRIIDKHHFHVSDETTVLFEILEIIVRGSKIVKNEDMNVEEIDEEEEAEEIDEDEEEEEKLELIDL